MSVAPIVEAAESVVDECLVQPLQDVGRWMKQWVADRDVPEAVTQVTRIDRIAELERLQASLEAVKNVEIVAFARARARAVEQIAAGVHPRKAEAGIADEIALAMRVSPSEGSRRLHVAKDLVLDMPHTLGLLAEGGINAGTARRVVEPLSHLTAAPAARWTPSWRPNTWTGRRRARRPQPPPAPPTGRIRSDRLTGRRLPARIGGSRCGRRRTR